MSGRGNYYGNMGTQYTDFSDENRLGGGVFALGATSRATAQGGSYSGGVAVGKPRVNSFSTGSEPQEYDPVSIRTGGLNRDSLGPQKGVRAASQDYATLKANEGDSTQLVRDQAGYAANENARRRNRLAVAIDNYNRNLSTSLRATDFSDQATDSQVPGLGIAFHPNGVTDYDGIEDSVADELQYALAEMRGAGPTARPEWEAASPELKLFYDYYNKSRPGGASRSSDFGTSGLSNYLTSLQGAGVMNSAYVNRLGSRYDGTAVVPNNSTRIGSSFNWGDIDSDFSNGFLPNSGPNLDQGRLDANRSQYPLNPRITSQAMYNPFTNSPVETSKNGTDNVYVDNVGGITPGFQWGQGMFSQPFAPYYATGYGDRFKAAPTTGTGPQQWARRPLGFSDQETVEYAPDANRVTTLKRVVGSLQDPINQKLASGQRESFSRKSQVDGPRLESTSFSTPETSLDRPYINGESTVDLGNIGRGFGSYRLIPSENSRPTDRQFGHQDTSNNLVYNTAFSGERTQGYESYMQDSAPTVPYNVRNSATGALTATIGRNNLRYLVEGIR